MKYAPVPLVGGYYADDTRSWSAQDCVNWLPTQAEKAGTRTASMLKTPPGLREFVLTFEALSIAGHLPDGAAGNVVSFQYTVTHGGAPYTLSIGSGALPAGLSMNSAGLITGTRTTAGTYNWTVHAVDVDGTTFDLADTARTLDSIVYVSSNSGVNAYAAKRSTGALLATINLGSIQGGAAINPAGTRVYITIPGANTVKVIDTSNQTVIATITVGTNPVDICVSKDGTRGYTANQTSNTVSVLDLTNNTLITTVAKGAAPTACNTNPVNGDIYIVSGNNSTVYVLNADGSTKTSVAFTNPSGVNASPDGLYFYVVGYDGLTAFNASTYTNAGNINLRGGYGPKAVVITPDGNTAYVSDYIYTDVKVVNVTNKAAMAVLTSVAAVSISQLIAMDGYGSKAYVTTAAGVVVIDVASNTIQTTLPFGNQGLAINMVPTP